MKVLAIALLLLAAAACHRGWTQGDRDKLVNSCVEKAQAGAPGIDATKLKAYCSCYQQNIEKKFPSTLDLTKATPEVLSGEAQSCLPLML